ncbi:MerR family transcriptional regulator [Pseudomonas aeruginosa]|uniref:MerR family transcriptional regulator n=1 Tax=Pseudomonas nicosulfuronedens TaxID=2571105 RepID=A0A5R9QMV1_9PSED|nr:MULTISPECIES: helix-turn-helix domain-containing protein [Pseudomonas]MBG6788808.1 helix-turn-helix domain-containing protein [Pseudomonas aeruginosa]MBH3799144.1 helix-turn-helix domain-containing protein [Pseudomonas aeruginosa]MBH9217120.1 helix-turn-helix domain-containing protein [Pseudomonas aeruginosa]MCT0998673.1 helix-turn-helix domain-containing protein [Pseudomonas aeruginosa]MCT1022495.1 helix-turn-helix domain-containing protein [Pseudomonas aeruginosa]
MDIADVARRSGVPASTLRFYEEKGLIASLAKPGARRQFAPQILDQLALITLGQSAGFSLEEIRSMFSGDGGANIDRQMLEAKADELDATIKRLRAMSRGLRHAAACPAPSHAECPTFQRLVKTAAESALAGKKERGRLKTGKA